MFVCLCDDVCGCQLRLTYLFRGPVTSDAPKFGTHVRIDTLTLNKNVTHPIPGGFRELSIVKNLSRQM